MPHRRSRTLWLIAPVATVAGLAALPARAGIDFHTYSELVLQLLDAADCPYEVTGGTCAA